MVSIYIRKEINTNHIICNHIDFKLLQKLKIYFTLLFNCPNYALLKNK